MQLKQKGDFLLKKSYKIFEQSVTDIFIILYIVKRDQIIASKLCQNKKLCKNVCFIVFVQELVNRSVPYSNIFVLSLPLLFLTLLRRRGVSPPFLISCASSLRFSVVFMLLRAQSAPPLPTSAVERLTLRLGSASLDPIISSSTPSAPVTDFAISFLCRFPRLSSSLSSLSLSRSILSLPSPRSSVYPVLRPSPRVLIWPPGVQLLVSFSL